MTTSSNTTLTAADLSRSNSNSKHERRAGSYHLARLCSNSIAKGLVHMGFVTGTQE
jgi:hypothetical protein